MFLNAPNDGNPQLITFFAKPSTMTLFKGFHHSKMVYKANPDPIVT